MYTYRTKGVCSREIHVDLDGDTIKHVDFVGGCDGNLKGIANLLPGMKCSRATPAVAVPLAVPTNLSAHCARPVKRNKRRQVICAQAVQVGPLHLRASGRSSYCRQVAIPAATFSLVPIQHGSQRKASRAQR